MMRYWVLVPLCASMVGLMHKPVNELPQPHYEPAASDPAWLTYAVQFHGHLGPWATAGTRAGMAGLRAVEAEGYFDVQVDCEGPLVKPPKSCFLDGLQVATGATLGKRNLAWRQGEQIVVRVKNTRTGRRVELRPTAELLELLHSFRPSPKAQPAESADDHHEGQAHADRELTAIARKIARMSDGELFQIFER